MKLTVDIIGDFIKSLVLSHEIFHHYTTLCGKNTVLEVFKNDEIGNTFHAREGLFLSIEGEKYKIVSVDINKIITIMGPLTFKNEKPKNLFFVLETPIYIHGVPIIANDGLDFNDENKMLPMIYLYEILKEVEKGPNSRIVRESDIRLYFLDSANFSEWSSGAYYTNRLRFLNNFVDFFIKKMRDYTRYFYLFNTDITKTNYQKWVISQGSSEKNIFSKELTATGIDFTLPLTKN